VWRDDELKTVPAAELVRGDILVLGDGDAVGPDARLITATDLRVSEAPLTGESEAVIKDPTTLGGDGPLGDRLDTVAKGTAVVQGRGGAVVTGMAMNTEVGAIAGMLERTESEPTPLQKEIAGVSKLLAPR
jgi:P-type Ca2+ transporter type 2C